MGSTAVQTSDGRLFRTLWIAFSYAVMSALVIAAVRRVLAAPDLPYTPSTIPAGIITWQLFLGVAAALAFAGLLIRLVNARAFLEILFGAALFFGVWAFAWFVLPWEMALLVASAITILQARVRRVAIHDAFVIAGSAGIAIHFAFIFSLHALGALLLAFFLYDLAQGRIGGAVVEFAKATIRRGVVPGLIVATTLRGGWLSIREAITLPDAVFLGAGDLILPVTLVARAAFSGTLQAVAVLIGILAGVFVLGRRTSLKPAPALLWLLPGAAVPYGVLMLLKMV